MGEFIGTDCSSCGNWIQPTGDWSCEECEAPTCQNCGVVDYVEKVFLCPECFSKENPLVKKDKDVKK